MERYYGDDFLKLLCSQYKGRQMNLFYTTYLNNFCNCTINELKFLIDPILLEDVFMTDD